MPKPRAVTYHHTQVAYVHRGIGSVMLRRFDPSHDSYEELTVMLHRSFARLGQMGFNCLSVAQPEQVTRERAKKGDCYVAVCNGHLVGTMTLYASDSESACDWYQRPDAATLRQFAVDPDWQHRGIGKSLLALAGHWAASRGYAELLLDTPQRASHLIAFYRGQGFRIVDVMRFPGRAYDSAVLGMTPVASRVLGVWGPKLGLPKRRMIAARAA
jgi:GNAT superfamily N-acetyltransferase